MRVNIKLNFQLKGRYVVELCKCLCLSESHVLSTNAHFLMTRLLTNLFSKYNFAIRSASSVVTQMPCVHNPQIRSDMDRQETMYYSLMGHGANRAPLNLFVVEETTGLVRIFDILDREERDFYIVSAIQSCASIMYED